MIILNITKVLKFVHDLLAPYEKESRSFVQAVRTGDRSDSLSTYEDAWKTQKVAIADQSGQQ